MGIRRSTKTHRLHLIRCSAAINISPIMGGVNLKINLLAYRSASLIESALVSASARFIINYMRSKYAHVHVFIYKYVFTCTLYVILFVENLHTPSITRLVLLAWLSRSACRDEALPPRHKHPTTHIILDQVPILPKMPPLSLARSATRLLRSLARNQSRQIPNRRPFSVASIRSQTLLQHLQERELVESVTGYVWRNSLFAAMQF